MHILIENGAHHVIAIATGLSVLLLAGSAVGVLQLLAWCVRQFRKSAVLDLGRPHHEAPPPE